VEIAIYDFLRAATINQLPVFSGPTARPMISPAMMAWLLGLLEIDLGLSDEENKDLADDIDKGKWNKLDSVSKILRCPWARYSVQLIGEYPQLFKAYYDTWFIEYGELESKTPVFKRDQLARWLSFWVVADPVGDALSPEALHRS
jgi:hypothetical protein